MDVSGKKRSESKGTTPRLENLYTLLWKVPTRGLSGKPLTVSGLIIGEN